jgi:hypothetical protein
MTSIISRTLFPKFCVFGAKGRELTLFHFAVLLAAIPFGMTASAVFASDTSQPSSQALPNSHAASSLTPLVPESIGDENRYGPFGLYDHRSLYGKGVFPEPFIVDDSDGEVNEFRLDWSHQGGKGNNLNITTAELEHGNGLWTLELEVPYEYDTVMHQRQQGFDAINPGARMPVFQYVSQDEFIDTTFGVAIEVGVPSNSPLGKNTEIVPKIFNDTRVGEHFTFQTILGYSLLRGSESTGGGEQHFEYGMDFGWTIPHNELPLPGVQDFIPLLELQGDLLTNTHAGGGDDLIANFAFRANLFSIGRVQPRLGVGYLVPLDKGARDDFHWGVYTSLVFEF